MENKSKGNPLESYILYLHNKGYSKSSIESVSNGCNQIRRFQEKMHEQHLNSAVLDAFSDHVKIRHQKGEIQKNRELFYLRIISQLRLYLETGHFDASRKNVPGFQGSKVYTDIIIELESSTLWPKPTLKNLIIASKSFFRWLDSHGIFSLHEISVNLLRQFLFEQIQKSRTKNIQDLRHNLKKFFVYLIQYKKIALEDCVAFLTLPIPMPHRLLPPAKTEYVAAVLDVIDKDTTVGKRDYAIILLAAKTGLRASDICSLKLEDLDWRFGKIHLVQQKNGKSVALPITKDIGNAISDYILNGRRSDQGCRNVFTRTKAPYTQVSTKTLNTRYNTYLKMAGINRTPDDGLSFHSLRRFVGTQLIASGSTIETVAQILGHSDIHSTEKYLSFDSKKLKACSLSFDGIHMKGGEQHVSI